MREAECDAEELLFGDCEPEPTVTTTPVTTVPGATTSRPKKDIPNTPVVEPTCGKRNPRGVDAVPVCFLFHIFLQQLIRGKSFDR